MAENLGFQEHNWGKDLEKIGDQGGAWDLMQEHEKSSLPAKFHMVAVHMKHLSKLHERPIYEDHPRITIHYPGGDVLTRPIKDEDKHRWPLQWEAFQKNLDQTQVGTPLEQWPQMTPSLVAMFKANNIFNVEGLAGLSDAHCEGIGNAAFDFRQRAQKYLAEDQGDLNELKDENAKLQAQNADTQEQLAATQAQLAALTRAVEAMNKPKRRGRPRKTTKKAQANVVADDDTGDVRPTEPAAPVAGDRVD